MLRRVRTSAHHYLTHTSGMLVHVSMYRAAFGRVRVCLSARKTHMFKRVVHGAALFLHRYTLKFT